MLMRENETRIIHSKKEMQYKNLPKEFNLVSLKARHNLNEIITYLKEKKERAEERKRQLEEERKYTKRFTKTVTKKKPLKRTFSISPSDEATRKVRQFKFYQKKNKRKRRNEKLFIKNDTK